MCLYAYTTLKITLCGYCGRAYWGVYDRTRRQVRDLSCGDMRIHLDFEVRRVCCRSCGKVKREQLEFLSDNPFYTKRFAHYVGRRCRTATINGKSQSSPAHPAALGLESLNGWLKTALPSSSNTQAKPTRPKRWSRSCEKARPPRSPSRPTSPNPTTYDACSMRPKAHSAKSMWWSTTPV